MNTNTVHTRKYFSFEEIENAFANGTISLMSFAEILADNLGRKKARKVLRRNLEMKMKELQMPFEIIQEHLLLISLLV